MIGSSHPYPSYQQHITTIDGIVPTLQNIVRHRELRLSFGPQNHRIALAPVTLRTGVRSDLDLSSAKVVLPVLV